MTAAFCISGNTFKQKTKSRIEYIQQHPLPELVYAVTVNFLSLFSFVLKKKKKEKKGKITSVTYL